MVLKRLELDQTNRPLDVVRHWADSDALLLSPPYQRGDVWGPVRRVNLIRSVLLGIPIPSIIVNDRFKAEWTNDVQYAVIDGKQRITTLLMFLGSQFAIPGEWLGTSGPKRFNELEIVNQRRIRNQPIAFSEGCLPTLEEEQLVFDLVNFGGVAQGESDND